MICHIYIYIYIYIYIVIVIIIILYIQVISYYIILYNILLYYIRVWVCVCVPPSNTALHILVLGAFHVTPFCFGTRMAYDCMWLLSFTMFHIAYIYIYIYMHIYIYIYISKWHMNYVPRRHSQSFFQTLPVLIESVSPAILRFALGRHCVTRT